MQRYIIHTVKGIHSYTDTAEACMFIIQALEAAGIVAWFTYGTI